MTARRPGRRSAPISLQRTRAERSGSHPGHLSLSGRAGRNLGGHEHRPGATHARQRRELEQRYAVDLPERSEVRLIEASPTDGDTAYVVGAAWGSDHPNIFRTRDAGKSWQKIVNGLPETAIARVVREDPARKGLLYAGTETGVYVSFDGGDHWQSFQFNLPTTSVRDLNVHGSDLVVATYGRGLWILDDLSPLRQVSAEMTNGNAYLFKPATAVRARWDNHPDTPLSADLPAGENPPDGAIIYYYLKSPPKSITLEIRDEHGDVVRRFSNMTPPADQRTCPITGSRRPTS